jgi:hypothetical protein
MPRDGSRERPLKLKLHHQQALDQSRDRGIVVLLQDLDEHPLDQGEAVGELFVIRA